jgi:hypothetical protein
LQNGFLQGPLLDSLKTLVGGRHVGLLVQLDKAGTTLAIKLCPSSSKPAAAAFVAGSVAAANPCSITAGDNTANSAGDGSPTTISATEMLLFSGTFPHAAARAAIVFTIFAVFVWWLWGRAVGGGSAAVDGLLSASGVLCGLSACFMWIRTLLFVFFQVVTSRKIQTS